MSNWRPIKSLSVKSGGIWHVIGKVLQRDDGLEMIQLNSLPIDPLWDGKIFPREFGKNRWSKQEQADVKLADFSEGHDDTQI